MVKLSLCLTKHHDTKTCPVIKQLEMKTYGVV